jgi:hypothetical protein
MYVGLCLECLLPFSDFNQSCCCPQISSKGASRADSCEQTAFNESGVCPVFAFRNCFAHARTEKDVPAYEALFHSTNPIYLEFSVFSGYRSQTI